MGEQLTLDSAPVVDMPARPPSLAQRYARWLDDNPHILDEVARTARELRGKGKRVSVNRCFEEMRERAHTSGDEFAMNNSYRAFVARDLAERCPDLADMFETRRSKADDRRTR